MPALCVAALALLLTGAPLDEWKPYAIDKAFTVEFPAKPTKDDEGIYMAFTPTGVYVASSESIAGAEDHEALGSFVDGMMAQNPTSKITSITDILQNGWRGLEFRWVDEDVDSWGRVFCVDGQLMLVQVSYDHKDGAPAGATKLFSSFKPTTTKAGAFTKAGPVFKEFSSKEFGYSVNHIGDPVATKVEKGPGKPKVDLFATRYGNRTYVSCADTAPTELPAELTDDMIEMIAEEAVKALAAEFGVKKLKSSWKRVGDAIEISFDGRAKTGMAGRFAVTLRGSLIFLRCFLGPEAMLGTKHVTEWFASFKFS